MDSMICKYWKQGHCHLGVQCQFHHGVQCSNMSMTRKSSNLENNAIHRNKQAMENIKLAQKIEAEQSKNLNLDNEQREQRESFELLNGHGSLGDIGERAPFLHIVVLYGTGTKVNRYAREIQQIFIEKRLDVYLQSENQHNECIKTENLASIITGSKADFLVVLGDRNMRNRSVQAKRGGKLVETKIIDFLRQLWKEWEQRKLLEQKERLILDSTYLTEVQIHGLLDKYAGVKHAKDRLLRLKETNEELALVKRRGYAAGSIREKELSMKLTQSLKSLIRLHQNLIAGYENLKVLPVIDNRSVLNYRNQRGRIVGPDYEPGDRQESISRELKEKLLKFINDLLPETELLGDQFSLYGCALWEAYKESYFSNEILKEPKDLSSPLNGDSFDNKAFVGEDEKKRGCYQCTFINPSRKLECMDCKISRSRDPEDCSPNYRRQAKKDILEEISNWEKMKPAKEIAETIVKSANTPRQKSMVTDTLVMTNGVIFNDTLLEEQGKLSTVLSKPVLISDNNSALFNIQSSIKTNLPQHVASQYFPFEQTYSRQTPSENWSQNNMNGNSSFFSYGFSDLNLNDDQASSTEICQQNKDAPSTPMNNNELSSKEEARTSYQPQRPPASIRAPVPRQEQNTSRHRYSRELYSSLWGNEIFSSITNKYTT